MKQSDVKSVKSDRQSIATIAESALARGVTGGESIVTTPAKRAHIGQGDRASVTRASTERDNGVVTATVKVCEVCGRQYVTARPTISKYCGPSCKRRGWLAADPERAARVAASDRARLRAHFEARGLAWEERGASRAGVAFWLAVLVAILAVGWYYGPTVQASRAAMAERAYTVTVSDPQRPAAAMPTPIVPAAQPQPTLPQNAPTIAPERPAAAMPTPQPQPAQPTPQPQISAAALARLDAQIAQAGRVVVECKAVQMADPFTNYHCERPARALATLQAQRAQVAP
jgi:hypothetical protein